MKLKKILVRYFPPGICLEYMRNGEMKSKTIDLLDLTPTTEAEDLVNRLMKTEPLIGPQSRSQLLDSVERMKRRLKEEWNFGLGPVLEHILPLTNANFNKDATKVITGSFDRTCKIWDAASGRLERTLEGHTGVVFDVIFNYPYDDRILTASFDQTAIVWDADEGDKLATLWGHTAEVVAITFEPKHRRIATASMDKTARIFDLATGVELWVVEGHQDALVTMDFAPDGYLFLTGSFDSNVGLWDTRTHSAVAILSGHEDSVGQVCFNFTGHCIASGSIDQTVRLWDIRNLKRSSKLTLEDEVLDISFDSIGKRLAVSTACGTSSVWSIHNDHAPLVRLIGHGAEVSRIRFSPGGAQVLTASADGTARIWSSDEGKVIQTLQGHEDEVFSCCYSYSGDSIVTASKDRTCRLWNRLPSLNQSTQS